MYAASRGHDICSSDPWVNGRVTDRQRALAYHPFAAGMRADAARGASPPCTAELAQPRRPDPPLWTSLRQR